MKFSSFSIIALLYCYSATTSCSAQNPDPRPLPDIATMMQAVEAHQKASEALIKQYIYTSNVTEVETDGSGKTRKTQTVEHEIFFVDGVRLARLLKKNGKELTPDEQNKEKERIDKEIARVRDKRARGGEKKRDEVSYARFLELGSFSNERRVTLKGRSTIALDYTGDPKARTKNPLEGAIHEMAGTIWVDEEDQALSRVEGHFANNFKVGGGLLVNVGKDTSFAAELTRVNGEVWLPAAFSAQGSFRALLFFSFHGRVSGTSSNYRKFKTGSTILPDIREIEGSPDTPAPPPATPPEPPAKSQRPPPPKA